MRSTGGKYLLPALHLASFISPESYEELRIRINWVKGNFPLREDLFHFRPSIFDLRPSTLQPSTFEPPIFEPPTFEQRLPPQSSFPPQPPPHSFGTRLQEPPLHPLGACLQETLLHHLGACLQETLLHHLEACLRDPPNPPSRCSTRSLDDRLNASSSATEQSARLVCLSVTPQTHFQVG